MCVRKVGGKFGKIGEWLLDEWNPMHFQVGELLPALTERGPKSGRGMGRRDLVGTDEFGSQLTLDEEECRPNSIGATQVDPCRLVRQVSEIDRLEIPSNDSARPPPVYPAGEED